MKFRESSYFIIIKYNEVLKESTKIINLNAVCRKGVVTIIKDVFVNNFSYLTASVLDVVGEVGI